MPLLETKKLTMRFGGLTAVCDVDVQVEQGKIHSIIGPNGAGKTTVFNAITGIYEPTEGEISFQGRDVRRPFTLGVLLATVAIGLVTGVAMMLACANVDKMWKAGVRRNFLNVKEGFNYSQAAKDGIAYLSGGLALERTRLKTWHVVSTEDKQLNLVPLKQKDDAILLRNRLEELLASGDPTSGLEQSGSSWVINRADKKLVLAKYKSKEDFQEKMSAIQADRNKRRLTNIFSLIGGFAAGAAGAIATWQRSRRTPDVISLSGIARTFQNIRLFQDMSVLENVLVGMDRSMAIRFVKGRNISRTVGLTILAAAQQVLRMALHTPGQRSQEELAATRARKLLEFVGLEKKEQVLAKNLPYGEQRLLEIARAMANEPMLLLLDEPAAGMNPTETAELMELIRRIRERKITILLIEHHMSLVMNISDRITVLDHGVKICEGTPAEVKCNPAVIEAYLGKEEVS